MSAAALASSPGCNRDLGPGTNLTLSLSTDSVKVTPGQTIDVVVTLKTSVVLDAGVVMSLRSPGDQPLPTGLNAAFDPPILSPAPGSDATAKLHLLAMTTLDGDSYPLVVYGRNQAQEATTPLTMALIGGGGNWQRPISSDGADSVAAMSGDHSDGVYVAVNTDGGFTGLYSAAGDDDAYLFHYRGNGALSFVTPLRTAGSDLITAMAVDADDNVYLAGYTYGAFPGWTSLGHADAFLAKVDPLGGLAWIKQIGTSEYDQLTGVAVAPDGSVFVGGLTEGAFAGYTNAGGSDAFVGHFFADGRRDWVAQFGSDSDERTLNVAANAGVAVTVDANGNLFVAGSTQGTLPGATSQGSGDAFIARLSPKDGSPMWLKQVGTYADDAFISLAAHSNGTIYASGWAKGPFPNQIQMGGQDALIVGYNPDGSQSMARQFGTSYADTINSMAIIDDHLYFAGTTRGAFPGQMQYGLQDIFFLRLGTDGTTQWLRQIGTTQADSGDAIAGSLGSGMNLYIGGLTFGDFAKDITLQKSDGFLNQYPLE